VGEAQRARHASLHLAGQASPAKVGPGPGLRGLGRDDAHGGERSEANSEIFKQILDNQDFRDLLGDYCVLKVYEQLREAA
jgi:hypothetical protein